MLERMKKPHTKVILLFEGPVEKQDEAIATLKHLGFNEAKNDSESWRNSFKGFEDREAGTCLTGSRHKGGLTQAELSILTEIPQRHISEMERGLRPIGKKKAKLFSKVLKVDYRMFL